MSKHIHQTGLRIKPLLSLPGIFTMDYKQYTIRRKEILEDKLHSLLKQLYETETELFYLRSVETLQRKKDFSRERQKELTEIREEGKDIQTPEGGTHGHLG